MQYNLDQLAADGFRTIGEIGSPDARWASFIRFQPNGACNLTIEDVHAALDGLSLASDVPEDIRVQFETGRMAMLHSWYAYRLMPLAVFQVFRTVEMALRVRLGISSEKRPGLHNLLANAEKQGLIADKAVM